MVFIWSGSQGAGPAGPVRSMPQYPAKGPERFHCPPQVQTPTVSVGKPALQPQPVANRGSPVPLSARERKQIYMHSTALDPKGAAPMSCYVYAGQAAAIQQIKQKICSTPRGPSQAAMPSAEDMRLTGNAGHSVITWDGAGGGKDIRWAETGDPIRVVHANKLAASTPTLAMGGKAPSAATRKLLEQHSSDVWVSSRQLAKSTSTPGREIRPTHFHNCFVTDSSIEKAANNEPRSADETPKEDARPKTARELRDRNANASRCSQFATPKSEKPSGPASPKAASPDGDETGRRRAERNYSDLFGVPSPRASPQKSVTFPDSPQAEPSSPMGKEATYRPHLSALASRAAPGDPEEDRVLPLSPRSAAASQASPKEKRVHGRERACWDSGHYLDKNAELARIQRSRYMGEDPEAEAHRSAADRKRAGLTSQGLRSGMGAPACPHEEDILSPRSSAAAALSPRFSPRAGQLSPRSQVLSPKSGLVTPRSQAVLSPRGVHARPEIAKMRHATALMSSGIF